MAEETGMTFFDDAAKDMVELTEEQKAAVAKMRKEGMEQEAMGLPLVHPRIEILHQDTRRFRFVSTENLVEVIDGIICYIEPSRVWWKEKFGSGEGQAGMPDCFSRDLYAPDKSSGLKQAETCGVCPKNQWGSDERDDGTMGKGKACKEIRRVFLIPGGHTSPHFMAIPPSSLRALASYLVVVADAKFDAVQEVVTRFKLVTKKNAGGIAYSELALELGGRVPEKWLALVAEEKIKIRAMLERAAPVSREEYQGTQGSS